MYVARQFEGMVVQETEGLERPQDEIARLSAHTVVDTDIHEIVRDKSDFAAYLESPWKEKVTHQLRTDEPLARGFTGTLPIDIDPQPYGLGEDVTPLTPAGIDAFMDQFNTDYALLHGSMIETITIIPEKEFAAALCAAYNDFLLEQYLDEFDGLKSLIRVAPQAPERAVEDSIGLRTNQKCMGFTSLLHRRTDSSVIRSTSRSSRRLTTTGSQSPSTLRPRTCRGPVCGADRVLRVPPRFIRF